MTECQRFRRFTAFPFSSVSASIPTPHFHAWHGGKKGVFLIKTGELTSGEMSLRDKKLIAAWAELYRKELMVNWNIARRHGTVVPIKPLSESLMRDITVRRVRALDDFKLDLTFSDGKRKIYDMKPQIWGAAFEPMKGNMDFFRKAFLWMGTVAWPENIDIAPEELYTNGVERIEGASGR